MEPLESQNIFISPVFSSKAADRKAAVQLRIILLKWITLVKNYNNLMREGNSQTEDAVYNYYEQPQTSVLAGAAWKSGFVALQDFDVRRKSKKRNGRADLYIGTDSHEFIFEAKALWIDSTQREGTWKNRIKNKAREAKEQINSLKGGSEKKFSLLFITPKSSYGSEKSQIEENCQTILKHCKTNFQIVAWVFPQRDRLYSAESSYRGVKRHYTGSIVAIK